MIAKGFIFAALITLLSIIKPITYRSVAQNYKLTFSSLFTSVWTGVFIILSFPFMKDSFFDALPAIMASPVLILYAASKGIVTWYSIRVSQAVNRQSTSSVVFFPFISLALASFLLNVFLGETLNLLQLSTILLLGILGFGFWFFGIVRKLSADWKKCFLIAIILNALCPIIDHITIRQIGWYTYFIISNITTFIFCFYKGASLSDIKKSFTSSDVFKAGFFNTLREIVVLSSSVAILPVSLVNFSIRLAAPIVMVFSAIKYKESTVKNQLIFGVLALLAAIPIILFK